MSLRVALVSSVAVLAAPLPAQELFLEPGALPVSGSNVQIGSDTTVAGVRLGRDASSDALFAVLRWSDGSVRVFRSTDSGQSWTLTSGLSIDASMFDLTLVGGYGYLCYAVGGDLRMRRFPLSTGNLDVTYGEKTVFSDSERWIVEVAMVGNGGDASDLLGCAAMMEDGAVGFYHAAAASGSPFVAEHPSIDDAATGLSMSWRAGALSGDEAIFFLSYVSFTQEVIVHRADLEGWDGGQTIASGAAIDERSTVSAAGDTALVAFETFTAEEGHEIAYLISDDRGGTWPPSPGLAFDGDPLTAYLAPLACACSGTGFALAAQHSSFGGEHAIEFRERHGYGTTDWLGAEELSDHDFWTSPEIHDFEWLGHGWGFAHVDTSGRAWFGFTPSIRYSGFEVGGVDEWSVTVGAP